MSDHPIPSTPYRNVVDTALADEPWTYERHGDFVRLRVEHHEHVMVYDTGRVQVLGVRLCAKVDNLGGTPFHDAGTMPDWNRGLKWLVGSGGPRVHADRRPAPVAVCQQCFNPHDPNEDCY